MDKSIAPQLCHRAVFSDMNNKIENLNRSLHKIRGMGSYSPETWESFYASWAQRVCDIGLNPQFTPLFKPLHLDRDKIQSINGQIFKWLKISDIVKHHKAVQRLLYETPSRFPTIWYDNEKSGIYYTLETLDKCRKDKELIVAALVCASYQTHFNNRPSRIDFFSNEARTAMRLFKCLATQKLWNADVNPRYHHAHSTVLPNYLYPEQFRLEISYDVKYFLALEHSILLTSHRPIVYEFHDHPDPFILKLLQEETTG
jgi:hypothetical protein